MQPVRKQPARKQRRGQLAAIFGLSVKNPQPENTERPRRKRIPPADRSPWTKDQTELLKQCYGRMPLAELAALVGKTVPAVSRKAKQLGLRRKKPPYWTEQELEFLETYWGHYTLPAIAKYLGRTETAVLLKAKRLGLGPTKFHPELLTACELSAILGVDIHTVTDYWISKCGLKARRKATRKVYRFYRIKINNFWGWAERNQDKFDSRRFKAGSLGKEPGWMELKRQRDKHLPARRLQKWTPEEDRRLIALFRAGNRTHAQIGEVLGRSAAAVEHRLPRIGRENIWNRRKKEAVDHVND